MKQLLITIAAVVLVGCGESQQPAPALEAKAGRPPWVRNSIQMSAMVGDIEAVKWHLANGADINATDNDGFTPLIWAAVKNKMKAVELLIAEGADVNAKDRFNKTPLYRAAFAGRSEIVRVLIAKGAGVNVKDAKGETPLDAAERIIEDTTDPHSLEYKAAKKRTADLLRKHGGKNGKNWFGEGKTEKSKSLNSKVPDISIHEAAHTGKIEAVKQHLAAGTNVNAKSQNGKTPLLLAANRNHKEIVVLLIAKGADVNVKDKVGWTSLHYAARKDHKKIAELIVAEGADIYAKSDFGRTPLDLAISRKHTETANLLRKHGGKTGEELKAEGK